MENAGEEGVERKYGNRERLKAFRRKVTTSGKDVYPKREKIKNGDNTCLKS